MRAFFPFSASRFAISITLSESFCRLSPLVIEDTDEKCGRGLAADVITTSWLGALPTLASLHLGLRVL